MSQSDSGMSCKKLVFDSLMFGFLLLCVVSGLLLL